LLDDPWEAAAEKYHEGQLVEGTVTNVVDFGAFVALDDGLEGLLHLSEMGDGSLKEPHSYVKKSDRLKLRISHLEPEKRRVGFTQRWGTEGGDLPPEALASAPPSAAGAATVVAQQSEEVPVDSVVVDENTQAPVQAESPAADNIVADETVDTTPESPASE